jgi:hypothetical protein
MSQFMTDAFTRLRCSGFVSVCLINGSAVGGGAEIATVCDYRYKINITENFFHPSEHYYYSVLTKIVVALNNLFFHVRLMIDTPEKYICFIHAKIGASPGWGGASRLVSIVGEKVKCNLRKLMKVIVLRFSKMRILIFYHEYDIQDVRRLYVYSALHVRWM